MSEGTTTEREVASFHQRYNCTPEEYVAGVIEMIGQHGSITIDPKKWPAEVREVLNDRFIDGSLIAEGNPPSTLVTLRLTPVAEVPSEDSE